jgi:uncharacterized membrane protein YqaE (UPF0057 family)
MIPGEIELTCPWLETEGSFWKIRLPGRLFRKQDTSSVASFRARLLPQNTPQMPILLIILAILLPPVAVALKSGIGKDFVINLILTLLFFLPGVIHALWLVLKK